MPTSLMAMRLTFTANCLVTIAKIKVLLKILLKLIRNFKNLTFLKIVNFEDFRIEIKLCLFFLKISGVYI